MSRRIYSDTGTFVVSEQPLAGKFWELQQVRIWDERTNTLSPPFSMGSVMAHTGGAGNPWREVSIDEAPQELQVLIATVPDSGDWA